MILDRIQASYGESLRASGTTRHEDLPAYACARTAHQLLAARKAYKNAGKVQSHYLIWHAEGPGHAVCPTRAPHELLRLATGLFSQHGRVRLGWDK